MSHDPSPASSPAESPVLATRERKTPRQGGGLAIISVRRQELRTTNQRREDRVVGAVTGAPIVFRRRKYQAAVLNVSRRGAMIECTIAPRIGERIELAFPGFSPVEATVRWVRHRRFGVEFAIPVEIVAPSDAVARPPVSGRRSGELPTRATASPRPPREAATWEGELFWGERSIPVHLRNVSAEGAMLAGSAQLEKGTEVVLALKSAGTVFATVRWCRSGSIGLKFDRPFDSAKLSMLAGGAQARRSQQSRPGIVKPHYLTSETDPNSPWAARWERLRAEDL